MFAAVAAVAAQEEVDTAGPVTVWYLISLFGGVRSILYCCAALRSVNDLQGGFASMR